MKIFLRTDGLLETQMPPATHERIPHGYGWLRRKISMPNVVSASVWMYGKLIVISALEIAVYPDKAGGAGPQWHISVSRNGRRPKDSDTLKALRCFRMMGSEEDNHHPGNARHFWLPCDPEHRVTCECKEEEKTVVDQDGYRWTTPKDGECRGCDFQRLIGKACPLHSGATTVGIGA